MEDCSRICLSFCPLYRAKALAKEGIETNTSILGNYLREYWHMKRDVNYALDECLTLLGEGRATLDEVGREIYGRVLDTAAGAPTASERLGHREFILTYKSFEPIGPACLPR